MPPVRVLLAGALLLRLLLPLFAYRIGGAALLDTPDSAEYLRLAASMLEGRFEQGQGPEQHRTPAYPLLLVPGVALGAPRLVTLPLQALLGTATVGLVFAMVRRWRGERAALFCATACAVEPVQLAWGAQVMSEALLTFFVALLAWALLQELEDPSEPALAGAALAAAAAAYVKPIAMFLPLWGAATLLVVRPGERRWRRSLAFVGVAWLAMAPWVVRNGLANGLWGFSSKVDRVLALSGPAAQRAEREGRYFPTVRAEAGDEPMSGAEYAAASRRGLGQLLADPLPWVRAYLKGMARTVFSPGAVPLLELLGHDVRGTSESVMAHGAFTTFSRSRQGDPLVFAVTVLLAVPLAGYLGLPLLGLVRGGYRDPRALALAGLVSYFVLLSGGAWGQSRFRHPVMPLLCVLAAVVGRSAAADRPATVST